MTAPRRRATIYHDLAELYAELAILEDQYENADDRTAVRAPLLEPQGLQPLGGVAIDARPFDSADQARLQPLRPQAIPAELAPREYAPRPQVHTPPPPPQASPGPAPVLDVNIATHCPKHGTEYRRGNYGPYCPSVTDDPAFADRKGYCNLPGQNAQRALAWIAVQKGASNVR